MKKYLTMAFVAAASIMLASCSGDEPVKGDNAKGEGVGVRFGVQLPVENTRSISDGLTAVDLYYAIYKKTGTDTYQLLGVKEAPEKFVNHEVETEIVLVNNVTYRIAFFAQNPLAPYTIDANTGVLSMNYGSTPSANSDIYDAFYTITDEFTVSNGMLQKNVTLYRPFAQVNVFAEDWQEAKEAGYVVSQTGMTFSTYAYEQMDLLTGNVSNPVELTYDLAALPDATGAGDAIVPQTKTFDTTDYAWVGMNYILVGNVNEIVPTLTFNYDGPFHNEGVVVNAVPVQRNYRTNIIGRFFTSKTSYKIIIEEAYTDDKPTVEI